MNPQTEEDSLIIADVAIVGNTRTNANIIWREMPFAIGDTVSTDELPDLLSRFRSNVFNLNLFLTVSVEETRREGNRSYITVTVKERWYLLILPFFSLADRSLSEWWYDRGHDLRRTTYGVQMQHINLTGNADQLAVKVFGGFIPFLEVSYSRPYIDRHQRMGIRSGVFYSTQRTMPFRTWNDKLDFFDTEDRMRVRKGGFVEYTYRNALYHSHKLTLGYTATTVADTILRLNPNYFLTENHNRQRFFSVSYDYIYDKRDSRQYTLKGNAIVGQIAQYGLLPNDDVHQLNVNGIFAHYFPIKGRFYGDFSLRGKVSFPRLQPYTLTTGLGYRNNLVRGYELNVIDGQDYAILRTNLKFQVLNRVFDLSRFVKYPQFNSLPVAVYVSTYGDAGAVRNYYPQFSNTTLGNRLLAGGGFGLDVIGWYDTVGRLNYSFNQFGESKLYFSIVRTL